MTSRILFLTALVAATTLSACNKRKAYPDTHPGWHNPGYTVVFGRLQRVPAPNTDAPPAWTLRFGEAGDAYGGEFALTPGERMIGFTGGERVEIRGRPLEQETQDAYNGRWYTVDSIKKWENYR